MTTRRHFLALSTLTIASSAWAKASPTEDLGEPVFSPASLGAYTQGLLSRKHLESLIGTIFMAFLDDDAVAYLRLKKVGVFPSTTSPTPGSSMVHRVGITATGPVAAVESFYAQFSTGGVQMKQRSYLVDHGTLGRFALFLVPSADTAPERTCTAVFTSFAH